MSFKQILGQNKPISILRNALLNNRLAHAYLFEGPSGAGKAFTALNFAKAINCLNAAGKPGDCCDECASCKKIDSGNHIDVSWLVLLKDKTQIAIEQIRQLQSQINLKPYEARYKVFCIQDAELMSADAQNALLKTLEEPPVKSILILISSRPSVLFSTVLSRCQAVKFSALNADAVKEILMKRYDIKSDSAYFLTYMAQSGLIDTGSRAKDDVLDEKNSIIDEFVKFLSRPGRDLAFLKESDEYILWVLLVLLWWFRDILILKETQSSATLANKDRIKDLKLYAAKYSSLELGEIIGAISRAIQTTGQTRVNPKLALTVMVTDIFERSKNVSGNPG